jgi:hypothetical protein
MRLALQAEFSGNVSQNGENMELPRKQREHQQATVSRKRRSKARRFPTGVGYNVPIPRDLLGSPAWMAMSHQCRKLVDALMMEWANHGGEENGNLKAPYDQLQARGLRREKTLDAILEAKALGIIHPVRGQRSYGSRSSPSVYRLTWLGTPNGLTATNEWRAIKTKQEAKVRVRNALAELKRERAEKRAIKAQRAAERDARRAALGAAA